MLMQSGAAGATPHRRCLVRNRFALLACLLMLPVLRSAMADPSALDPESRISLREAVLLALRNNLDVEIARTDHALAAEDVHAARGAYDPIAQTDFSFDRTERLTANTLQASGGGAGVNLNAADGWTYRAQLSGILPFGLQYSSSAGLNRLDSNQIVVLLDKQYSSAWDSRLTLPLMRDLRLNDASVTVRRSEIALDISREQLRGSLTDIIAAVEDLYWNLAATQAAAGVAAKSLKTAQDLLERAQVQEQVGVVARVAVTQAEAGVAEREVLLIQAENRAASAKDALLDAILAPSAEGFEDRALLTEAPRFEIYDVRLD